MRRILVFSITLVLISGPALGQPDGSETGCLACVSCPGGTGPYCAALDGPPNTGVCTVLQCERALANGLLACSDPNFPVWVNGILEANDASLENFPPPWPGCPTSEAGRCADGVNNDAWLDDLTDCADPDCANDPACPASAPALSTLGLGALAALLMGIGGLSVARRRRS